MEQYFFTVSAFEVPFRPEQQTTRHGQNETLSAMYIHQSTPPPILVDGLVVAYVRTGMPDGGVLQAPPLTFAIREKNQAY